LLRCDYLTIALAEARGQFGNPKERERPPLEAVTIGLVKKADWEGLMRAIVNCRLCRSVNSYG
jgi:hypothetical protein